MDFGLPKPSPNPSKIQLKSMSQKLCDFSSIFPEKMLCRKSADIDFVLVFPIQNGSRTLFFKSLLAYILGPKSLPKTVPKRGLNLSKIDVKNVLFFNIVFFASWSDFGASWASKLEPSWPPNGKNEILGALLAPS